MKSLLTSTLGQGAFWMVNKKLARYLQSNDAALLLADLISRRDYFEARSELDTDEGFFALSDSIEEDLNLTKESRQKLTKQLEVVGFLKIKKKGLPSKNYYYIQDSKIVKVLEDVVKKSNDFQWAEKSAQYRAENPIDNRAEKDASNKNKEKREEEKISQEDIYRKWLSEIPEQPDFKSCYEELLVLFESLKSCGFSESDISSSLKKKIMSRWSRSKYPDKHAAWWDKAIGATFNSKVALVIPEMKESSGVKIRRQDGQISIDAAIAITTSDDVIQQMMREYDEIRSRSALPEGFENE
jgi:hypothetical protein